jgi:predicted PurR-regulated permease PerM
MDLTKEQIEQFKQLNTVEERAQWILGHWQSVAGTYDRWLDTNAGKVQTLQNSWNNFMSQIQQLALGIYAVFAPVLTHLINMFTLLGDHINKVFGTSIETARANNAKNILKQSSAIDKLTKSTDKNTKANLKNRNKNNLASFDDIISLSKDTSNKDDTKSQAKNLANLSKLLEDYGIKTKKARTEWDKYRDSIEKALDNKNYEKAGLLLSKYFDSLMKFDWPNIKQRFKDGSTAVARFLNGIFGNEKSFKNFGSNIAEVLNTIAITIDAFFTNFDFGKAGTSLAQSFNAFVSKINAGKAAKTLANVFKGIINLASSYIMSIDRSKVVKKISNLIYTFFTNFTSEDADKASKAVLKAIGDVLTIVGTGIYDIVSNAEFGNIVGTVFENIATWVGDNGEQIGKNISDILTKILEIIDEQILSEENIDNFIKGIEGFIDGILDNSDEWLERIGSIIDKITEMIEKWRTDGTLQKITDFILRIFTETNLPDLIFNIISVQSEIKAAIFFGKVLTKIKLFLSFLGKVIGPLLLVVLTIIFGPAILVFIGVAKTILSIFKKLYPKIKDIFDKVGKFIKGIVDGIHGAFKKLKKAIKGIIDTVIGWIEGLIEKVQGAFDKVGGIAKNIKKTVGGAFDKVSNLIPKNVFNIQAHATGGITNGPSIGLIGEQGKEAVLPLERGNTLQMLGNAILNSATVNKTQQSRSSKIDINISGFNKEFYTKAEVKNIANGIADILVQGGYSLT